MKFCLILIAFILLVWSDAYHACIPTNATTTKEPNFLQKTFNKTVGAIKSIPDNLEKMIRKIPGVNKVLDFAGIQQSKLIKGLLSGLCEFGLKANFNIVVQKPAMHEIKFEIYDQKCKNDKIPLDKVDELVQWNDFNSSLDTVILFPSWTIGNASNPIDHIAKAYKCRGEHNILVVDGGLSLKEDYKYAAENTEVIGNYVAIALQMLSKKYDIDRVHLIGFSLGAQTASAAGRNFDKLTGRKLYRITGLDPAYPCFYVDNNFPGLRSNDAEFVDVITTYPTIIGTQYAGANVDYHIKPSLPLEKMCFDVNCDHDRAVEYYAATVYPGYEQTYKTIECSSGRNATMGLQAEHLTNGNCTVNVNNEKRAYDGDKCGGCNLNTKENV